LGDIWGGRGRGRNHPKTRGGGGGSRSVKGPELGTGPKLWESQFEKRRIDTLVRTKARKYHQARRVRGGGGGAVWGGGNGGDWGVSMTKDGFARKGCAVLARRGGEGQEDEGKRGPEGVVAPNAGSQKFSSAENRFKDDSVIQRRSYLRP